MRMSAGALRWTEIKAGTGGDRCDVAPSEAGFAGHQIYCAGQAKRHDSGMTIDVGVFQGIAACAPARFGLTSASHDH